MSLKARAKASEMSAPPSSLKSHPSSLSLPEDVVLSVRNVSKKFCRNLRRSMAYGLRDLAFNLSGVKQDTSRLRRDEFWALRDINLDLKRGEVLGLIGPNGSGKTTLLRLLAGIFPPDRGEVAARGRVGALIALGAGFHPHLTGRENIYLNAAILGIGSREVEARFRDIVDFAEIAEFIDAPVSAYSSGMKVRLGFSIAVQMRPDILLVDEVLAVGDSGFKIKCLNAINELLDRSGVVFVSHSMPYISRACTRVIYLERGRVELETNDVSEGINFYHGKFQNFGDRRVLGPGKVRLGHVRLSTPSGGSAEDVVVGREGILVCDIPCRFDADVREAFIKLTILDNSLRPVAEAYSKEEGFAVMNCNGELAVTAKVEGLCLNSGSYALAVAAHDAETKQVLANVRNVATFTVSHRYHSSASFLLPCGWSQHAVNS